MVRKRYIYNKKLRNGEGQGQGGVGVFEGKVPEYSKPRSQLLAEKILKSISSAVYLSQHLLFSELTQPFERTQKVNKGLTPSEFF